MAKEKRGLKAQPASATQAGDESPDVKKLAADVRRDRIRRKMTWPVYARFLGVPLTTIYKLAKGYTTRPHELTLELIRERLAAKQAEEAAADQPVTT